MVALMLGGVAQPVSSAADGSLTLGQALEYARKHSPQLRGAEAAVDAAHGQQWETLGEFLPQMHWNMQFTRNSKAPLGSLAGGGGSGIRPSFTSQEFYSDSLAISQKVFTWKMAPALRASQANVRRTVEDRMAAENDLTHDATTAFYGLLYARQTVVIAERAESVARTTHETSEKLYKEGKASSFDVSRAKVRWVNSRTDVIRARNGLRLARERLAVLLGWNDAGALEIQGSLERPPAAIDLAGSLDRAEKDRPELVSIRAQQTLLRSNVEVARSFLIPSVSAGFSYQFEDPSLTSSPDYKAWAATATLAVPLFDGLTSYGRLSAARAQVRRSQAAEQQIREAIDLEVRQAVLSLGEAGERIEAQRENVSTAKENLRIAQERFRLGLLSLLDLKDAELTLTQAETAHAEALFHYQLAATDLEHAMGGPIEPGRESTPKGD
ncbi:MAG: TolC family protein [Nitrospirae bacterium]|nr:TolC family protein [Nitrospirota bacterium]